MASSEVKLNNNASSASNSWLLPIEQRISSVQKETEELKRSNRELERSNRELSRQLLLLRSQNAARRNSKSDVASAAPAGV
jgi:transposase-like protein